jgi:hypothetical protein
MKPIVFPEIAVQVDRRTRPDLMPAPAADLMNKLNELDQRFYRCPDSLGETEGLRTRTGTGFGGNRRQAGTESSGRSHFRKQNPEREFNSGHQPVEPREYCRRGSNSLAGLSKKLIA